MVLNILIDWIIGVDIMSIDIKNYSIPDFYIWLVCILVVGELYIMAQKSKNGKTIGRPKKQEMKEIYYCTTCGSVCSTIKRLIEHNLHVHNQHLSEDDARLRTESITIDEFKDLQKSENDFDKEQEIKYANMQNRIDAEIIRPVETEPNQILSEEDVANGTPDSNYLNTMDKLGTPKVAIPLNGFCDISFVDNYVEVSAQFKVMNTPDNWDILAKIGKLKRI